MTGQTESAITFTDQDGCVFPATIKWDPASPAEIVIMFHEDGATWVMPAELLDPTVRLDSIPGADATVDWVSGRVNPMWTTAMDRVTLRLTGSGGSIRLSASVSDLRGAYAAFRVGPGYGLAVPYGFDWDTALAKILQ